MTDIPFPDVLHVHHQCLNGFERLATRYGNFVVNEDCIGINDHNTVKVWHNHEYDEPFPKTSIHSEQEMVSDVIDLI